MEPSTKGNLETDSWKEKEQRQIPMEASSSVNSTKILYLVKEGILPNKVNMLVNFYSIKDMVKAFSNLKMEISLKENFRMIFLMEKASSWQMARQLLVFGKMETMWKWRKSTQAQFDFVHINFLSDLES